MDIHKPKPIRNWREFAKEYAIIVLGVATALAAEQAVEWLHWQGEVKAARTALRAEMAVMVDFYGRRAQIAACVDAKLDKAAALVAAAAAGRRPELGDMRFNGLGAFLNDSEWQSQRASQTLTHFPREELALMSSLYGMTQDFRDWNNAEALAWSHLAVLQDAGQKLGPDDLAQLRLNLHTARRFAYITALNVRRQLDVAARLGLKPAVLTPAAVAERCNRVSDQIKY